MKSLHFLSAFVCLAAWTNHASAFVIPTPNSCRSVGCWPTATFVGMTKNAANEEDQVAPVEEEATAEPVLQSITDAETEANEETEEASSEEETTIEAVDETEADEETEANEETEEVSSEEETTIEAVKETEAVEENPTDPVEEETAVEPTLESSSDDETETPKKDEAEAKKKEIPWMELLGAAAELAGAVGSAAAKAASAALDDMTPKEVIDVSIPYDSASFLAYSEWLAKNKKEDPELERYDYFKKNYRAVVISNVIAKKMIREGIPEGETPPELLKLNQYADLSTEEYLEVQKSLEPKSWGDLFGELASVAGKAAMNMASGSSAPAETKTEAKPAPASKKKAPVKKALFKKAPVKKVAVKKTPAKEPPKADSGFTFFGIGTKSVKKPPQAKKQPPRQALQKAAPAKKKAPAAIKVTGIPVLSRWKQNKDGSLTGYVSNSSSFRSGTRITTSPVPKGAKGGMVVRTGSGSRYKLK